MRALATLGWIQFQFQFEDKLAEDAISIFLRCYSRGRIERGQISACLFVVPQYRIEHGFVKFLKSIVGVVSNEGQLFGAIPNVVVYGLQAGAVLFCQVLLFGNSPCFFHDRSGIFEDIQQFYGSRHPIL